jgi:hypothetical protein
MGSADEEDEPVEEADDLQGLGADEVERRLADSVKFQMMRVTLLTGFFRYRCGRATPTTRIQRCYPGHQVVLPSALVTIAFRNQTSTPLR